MMFHVVQLHCTILIARAIFRQQNQFDYKYTHRNNALRIWIV